LRQVFETRFAAVSSVSYSVYFVLRMVLCWTR
jgi:hypothetical protein